jgi:diadenosine tetraphosphate (Ap4A) HIT family hydrolase
MCWVPPVTRYHKECVGCRTSQNLSDAPGGIVELSGDWILNQCRAPHAYLGWLVMQPRFHRDEIAELTEPELSVLGFNMNAVDSALRSYWATTFPDDPIERVYFVHFFESPFDVPRAVPFHLHVHAIPRTRRIGAELREQDGGTSFINAWKINTLWSDRKIPTCYARTSNDVWPAAVSLLRYLRDKLTVLSAAPISPPSTARRQI